MELSKKDIKVTKGIAILFMVFLHLFCRKNVDGLYETIIRINEIPIIYYLAVFCDACVPIFCFTSGYGLYIVLNKEKGSLLMKNFRRMLKLLVNYWIVLVLFVVLAFFVGVDGYPGSIGKFILNFLVLSYTYCGSWWFLQSYIILLCIAPLLFKVIDKYESSLVAVVSSIIYLICYLQRIKYFFIVTDNSIIYSIVNAVALLGTSQFPFILGVIAIREKIYSKINKVFCRNNFKNIICVLGIITLILIHAFIETMFIAPFTGIIFVFLFNIVDKHAILKSILIFFSRHSTNIWLTHMLIYMTIFPRLVFVLKFPLAIFFVVDYIMSAFFMYNQFYSIQGFFG